jgi:hypothetical protein
MEIKEIRMKSNNDRKGRLIMKLASGILGIALLLTCGGKTVLAQSDVSNQKTTSTNTETMPKTYRLTYTITESDGVKHLGTQHFALTVNPETKDSEVKLGSRVPIATGSYQPQSPSQANVQFQYVDVGLNLSVHIREFAGGVEVHSKLEQSSVAEEKSSVSVNDPVIRQATLMNTALLTAGKPVMLGSLDVPGSTRHLDIEVVLELVK